TVLLKGRPTMVFHPERGSCLLSTGNSGMATGGSGDVLSGIAGALLAQEMEPFEAAILSAYAHGLAADIATSSISKMALIPSDIAERLGRAFRTIENGKHSELVTSGGKWRSV
ncbi:MAG: bifunctional ADP-dependent NAD(P)H-hydrate dehydratase/NAD(P)H-hydrate epimerase, partial [Candidatus Aegiribacteria sp.]|nr:bifunctional ADP-dependent NAD(P)H-hydrate dehydratase/NAD(P)H-hydrate epimerase [Candidatus Aegiribacteria sp.]